MDENYFEKIRDIEKLLQGWLYRHLSPYGKITVIKSLALSKLSHIALVVPTLTRKDLVKLEKILLQFLWSNKSVKVSKLDCYKPQNRGGLGMVDIFSFWQSLKCTWLRRLLKTSAFWPKILDHELLKINANSVQLLFSGPSQLNTISKKLTNKFWKNMLTSLANLQREAAFATPENFYLFSFFGNPLFKKGTRPIARTDLGNPGHYITQVGDFFKSEGSFLKT